MRDRIKLTLLALGAAAGVWLTFQHGVEGSIPARWSCASSKAIFCIQK